MIKQCWSKHSGDDCLTSGPAEVVIVYARGEQSGSQDLISLVPACDLLSWIITLRSCLSCRLLAQGLEAVSNICHKDVYPSTLFLKSKVVKESHAKPEEENMVLVRLLPMFFVPYKKEQNVPAKTQGFFTYKKRSIGAQSSGTESISGARRPGIGVICPVSCAETNPHLEATVLCLSGRISLL